ncbi:ribonuclease P protein component [Iodidimonas muriae]|uniref:Ribonuclease P protein component n=1 Tax=Iodidimonas muriae TaxID=261467 RepID=A0ABQ2LBR1_9PROT|nr:ribonuclease P protein component [Iodidimonas muriae]GER06181.1 ribonuclease P protein component [Kordiimonadales bacterium JCM 17843]GGO08571.1 ribonuclease P protein component [Iodidimonas muriae]
MTDKNDHTDRSSMRSVLSLEPQMSPKTGSDSAKTAPSPPQNPALLPKKQIIGLKQRRDYLRVARSGIKAAQPGLVLQAAHRHSPKNPPNTIGKPSGNMPSPAAPATGFGITASKKVGNAVARNRAKRRLRALVAHIFPVEAEAGMDYVLIARSQTVKRPYKALEADLRRALDRVSRRRAP